MRLGTVLALVGAFVLACVGLSAQQTLEKAPAPAAAKKQPEQVQGQADYIRADWGDKQTRLLKGNVSFVHGDTRLTSDLVQYDGAEKVQTAVSPGKITITNPECDITGDKGTAFFLKRLGIVEGNVVMNLKPKPANDQDKDKGSVRAKLSEPTTITCKRLEYLYRKKIATMIGDVVFKQAKRSASADKAVYDQNKELLVLTGHVKAVDDKGQEFEAPGDVTVSLKKGDEWMDAKNASATFKVDLEGAEEPGE